MYQKSRFTSQQDARSRAIKCHLCTACLYNQRKKYKDCPKCHAPAGMRVYMPSRAEHLRAVALIQKHARGEISQLKFHPGFDLIVDGKHITKYVADCQYVDENGKQIIEDTKATNTNFIEPVAELKIALFNALYAKHGLSVKIHRNAH